MAVKNSEMNIRDFEHNKLFQVLSPDGKLVGSINGIDEQTMVKMYEQMLLVRAFDRKSVNLQRQGRMGTYAMFEGQEASQVGSAMALSPFDWMFPTYRDHAAAMVHGQDMYRTFLYWMGHADGATCPEGKRILPASVPIATHMIHAVGTAWASKLNGEETVSIAYFGDGATSEGDFHEALNFAGVLQTPTIFFCQNNGYAISVPFEKQSASRTISQRALAYDMKGVRVDGNDVFAVYLAVKEAAQRARNGEGPTLIEAMTFRYGAHTTADDPKKYRDQEKLAKEWRETKDPIIRLQKFLQKKGLWTEEREEELVKQFHTHIDEQLQKAESHPKLTSAQLFDHVYAEAPWQIKEQRAEFEHYFTKDVK